MVGKDKNTKGMIPNQPQAQGLAEEPFSLVIGDTSTSSVHTDINVRDQTHDWDEIRGKTPRHGAIAEFVHPQSEMGTSGRRHVYGKK